MTDFLSKKPKLLRARIAGLRLTPEERLVMARIDGELSVEELVGATGLEGNRVEQIVSKLALDGALDLADERALPAEALAADGSTTSLAEFAAALGMDPGAFGPPKAPPAPPAPEPPEPATTPLRPQLRRYSPVARTSRPDLEQVTAPVPEPALEPEPLDRTAEALDTNAARSSDPDIKEGTDPSSELRIEAAQQAAETETQDERSEREKVEQDEQSTVIAERNYRQIFEARWHPLNVQERAAAARTAAGPDLLALCFDPTPQVISSVVDNALAGLDHARLIALHHRTGVGLEVLARRREWLRDGLVERRLLRNSMVGDIVLGRIMAMKRLLATYKIAVDREVPDITRAKSRGQLRQKWASAPPEDRADLLLRTEARCLMMMTGCTFDAKTTAILCGRPINSVMFVQSVARFPGSPPALLAHLYKQPFVRKNPSLRKMLFAHPNLPGDSKRL